jgi:hypothetical protein
VPRTAAGIARGALHLRRNLAVRSADCETRCTHAVAGHWPERRLLGRGNAMRARTYAQVMRTIANTDSLTAVRSADVGLADLHIARAFAADGMQDSARVWAAAAQTALRVGAGRGTYLRARPRHCRERCGRRLRIASGHKRTVSTHGIPDRNHRGPNLP